MRGFIELNMIDENGSGLQFPTLFRIDKIMAVIDVNKEGINLPAGTKCAIRMVGEKETLYVSNSFQSIKGMIKLFS